MQLVPFQKKACVACGLPFFRSDFEPFCSRNCFRKCFAYGV